MTSELWKTFEDHFPKVVQALSSPDGKHAGNGITWSYERIKEVLEYNVPFGKRTRGLTVVSSFKLLMGNCSQEELEIALSVGWAVEILQASFLVADDVMDQSQTRRGQLCWFRKPGIGLQAINDSMILESCVFSILRLFCRKKSFYADLVDLFHQVILNTEMGQSLDMLTSEQPTLDLKEFTPDRYAAMIKYKTAYYSFYLPVAVAMYMAGISDAESHEQSCSILCKIGSLFQIQDDYLDLYGDPAVTGKIGTDIEESKCSWLVIEALKRVTDEQCKVLETCYGQKDPEKVQAVKDLYRNLELEAAFKQFEEVTYNDICSEVEGIANSSIPKEIYLNLLKKIYKRQK
uniref:Farnesyl pyrophosphate synthase n=1 Tax=Phallusia mammillata TaxID=59560 RepID=A0A6F9DDC0_9ASCI|nr:farnesyl pyrophosphate synthase-like [Phallusia mammillata]